MGNQLCVDENRPEPKSIPLDLENLQANLIYNNRSLVQDYPTISLHPSQKIKKLTRHPNPPKDAIWKVKNLNIYYMNQQAHLAQSIPRGYCIIYKMKENGDFAGYFEGTIDANQQIVLTDSIFVFHNASHFLGTGENKGIYMNQVTGLKYEGGWDKQKPDGYGKQKNNKGQYEGNYCQGEKDGAGKFVWNDGTVYQGHFSKGLFHHQGHLQDPTNQYSYKGEFEYGEKQGSGIETFENESYEGDFVRGKRHGHGKLTIFSAGIEAGMIASEYEGRFEDNVPHGKGKYDLKKKLPIEGIWNYGLLISLLRD